jgi:hydrogenase maturation protease
VAARSLVVIGVGNRLRGDDGAGLEVVRRLTDLRTNAQIALHAHEGEGVGLLELWDGADVAVLVDCMRSGAAPGTVRRIDMSSETAPVPLRGTSSHATGVAEAIELARALGALPSAVIVYGVEGASFGIGAGLSDPVADAIDLASEAVRQDALELLRVASRG